MSYKVVANFRDKITKREYKKGDSFSSDDKERIAFLVKRGFIKEAKKKEKPKKSKSTKK